MKRILTFTAFLFFTLATFAQGGSPGKIAQKKAEAAEKAGQYAQAAIDYNTAGNEYKAEADEAISNKFTDLSIYKLLVASRDAYTKAAVNFKKVKKNGEELEAQKQALLMGLRALEYAKKAGVIKEITPLPKEKPKEDKEILQESDELDKQETFLYCKKATFAIKFPLLFKHLPPKEQIVGKPSPTFTALGIYSTDIKLNIQYRLEEWIEDAGTRSLQEACEFDMKTVYGDKGDYILPASTLLGKQEVKQILIGQTKACFLTTESQQIDTKDHKFSYRLYFYYKRNSYLITGIAPQAWKNAILRSLRSFRIVGEENQCSNKGQTQDIPGLAFEDSWELPSDKADVKIVISSNLPRGHVPEGWNMLIAGMKLVLEGYEKIVSITEEAKPDEVKRVIFVLKQLGFDEITPQKVFGAYLEVMDRMVNGIRDLESRISNMSSDLYYEIPTREIKTRCIPRLICNGEKWLPDYRNMSFEKISEKETLIKSPDLKFLSPGQLRVQLDEKLKGILEKMKNNMEKYAKAAACNEHRSQLYGLQFPSAPDECKRLEAQIENCKLQLELIEQHRKDLKKQLDDWGNSKSSKIAALEKSIAKNNTDIAKKKEELRLAIQQKHNYENDKLLDPAQRLLFIREINEKIARLQTEINALEVQNSVNKRELDYLKGTAFEEDIAVKNKELDNEEKVQNSRKSDLEKKLVDCKANEKLYKPR